MTGRPKRSISLMFTSANGMDIFAMVLAWGFLLNKRIDIINDHVHPAPPNEENKLKNVMYGMSEV